MKSKKERHDYLKQILYDAGLSKSTMMTAAACKRLKAARERAKEISELDVGNIIDNGEGKRSSRRTTAASSVVADKPAKKKYHKSLEEDDENNESSGSESEAKADDFTRIKDLIESDESETDKKKAKKQVSKKTVSDSE